jgi:hypothetical protein
MEAKNPPEPLPPWKASRNSAEWKARHAEIQRQAYEKKQQAEKEKRKAEKEKEKEEDEEARRQFKPLMEDNKARIAALPPLCSPKPPVQRTAKRVSKRDIESGTLNIWSRLPKQQRFDWLVKRTSNWPLSH